MSDIDKNIATILIEPNQLSNEIEDGIIQSQ